MRIVNTTCAAVAAADALSSPAPEGADQGQQPPNRGAGHDSHSHSFLEAKLRAVNLIILAAGDDIRTLELRLGSSSSTQSQLSQQRSDAIVAQWVQALGRGTRHGESDFHEYVAPALEGPTPDGGVDQAGAGVLTLWQADRVDAASVRRLPRWKLRTLLMVRSIRERIAAARAELELRSEVFRQVFRKRPVRHPGTRARLSPCSVDLSVEAQQDSHGSHVSTGGDVSQVGEDGVGAAAAVRTKERALTISAICVLGVGLASAIPAMPLVICLVPLGAIFPFALLGLSLAASTPPPLLPSMLTLAYSALLVAMVPFVPAVNRFQALRSEILPTAALPGAFFSPAVVDEMRRRWRLAAGLWFGTECTVCCESLGAGEEALVLNGCNHAFHRACIQQWLGYQSSCPNCRSSATMEALTPVCVPPA